MSLRGLGALTTSAWLLAAPVCAQVVLGNARSPGITIHVPAPPPQPPPAPPAPPPRTDVPHHPPYHQPGPSFDDDRRDLFRARRHTYAPRYDRRVPIPFYGYPTLFPYVVDGYVPAPAPARTPPLQAEAGYLRLQIEPPGAHVYIDGFFVGAAEDLPSRLPLEPGPHRVEIRADGFETVAFDVRVRPLETLTFTKELGRLAPAPSARATAPVTAVAAKALYVIPRCYAGDRPPQASALPAGCSVDAVRRIAPAIP